MAMGAFLLLYGYRDKKGEKHEFAKTKIHLHGYAVQTIEKENRRRFN